MAGLADSYRRCQDLHRRHGRTYYLATRLLPAWKRRHVHALYGFTRYADDIVDGRGSATERAAGLRRFADTFLGGGHHPLLPAVRHTIAVFGLDPADFAVFLRSMEMDLTVDGYADYPALLSYMDGSAAAVGTMMLPILEPADPAAAREPARQLGIAFQLTNFIRDVGEDVRRGRVYLPAEDMARYGVTRADLAHGRATPAVRALIAYEVERARAHYAAARPGLRMLAPSSRPCIGTAFHVYGGILDEVERAGYDVLTRRVVVPPRRRLLLAARGVCEAGGIRATAPERTTVEGGVFR